jgi:DNA-binding NtrC family response regulator
VKTSLMENQKDIKIFLVDDDPFCLSLYEGHLRNLGYHDITRFGDGFTCLDALDQKPDIIFIDQTMEGLTGIDVLKRVKYKDPDIYTVFVSGIEDIRIAINSIKNGAFDFIIKNNDVLKKMEKVMNEIITIQLTLKKHPHEIYF